MLSRRLGSKVLDLTTYVAALFAAAERRRVSLVGPKYLVLRLNPNSWLGGCGADPSCGLKRTAIAAERTRLTLFVTNMVAHSWAQTPGQASYKQSQPTIPNGEQTAVSLSSPKVKVVQPEARRLTQASFQDRDYYAMPSGDCCPPEGVIVSADECDAASLELGFSQTSASEGTWASQHVSSVVRRDGRVEGARGGERVRAGQGANAPDCSSDESGPLLEPSLFALASICHPDRRSEWLLVWQRWR